MYYRPTRLKSWTILIALTCLSFHSTVLSQVKRSPIEAELPSEPTTKFPAIVYSVQSEAAMQAKSGSGSIEEAESYKTLNHEPLAYSIFLNLGPTTGQAFPGAMMADNMGLDAGFQPNATEISSYDLLVIRSSNDPIPGSVDFHVELWDGDPLCALDDLAGGYACAPIPGTGADFVDIPSDQQFVARADLPPGVTAPHQRVWMVVSGSQTINPSPCRLGWDISYGPAVVGDNIITGDPVADDIILTQEDETGVGSCCTIGNACNLGVGATCAGDDDGLKGFCTDGDAESPHMYGISTGPGTICDQHAGSQCANFVATIRSPANTSISLVPIGNDPLGNLDSGVQIANNEIVLSEGGTTIALENRISDWTPSQLKAWEIDLDSSGYSNSFDASLAPNELACTSDADCRLAYGGACNRYSISPGAACTLDADCPEAFPGAPSECTGSRCTQVSPSGTYCEPGFLTTGRLDYVYAGIAEIPGVDISNLDYRYASAFAAGDGLFAPSPFPAEGLYAGSLVLDVPVDAKGTFTVGFKYPPNTVMRDDLTGDFIPLVALNPARITVQLGRCCYSFGTTVECADQTGALACAGVNGASHFTPGATCEAGTNACDLDCNNNGVNDLLEIANGTVNDCEPNGIPDECESDCNGNGLTDTCDLNSGASVDLDENGIPDECECPPPTPAAEDPAFDKNRYLSISRVSPALQTALRVTLVDLPAPFDAWNDISMWATEPTDVSLFGGLNDATPPTFKAATLACQPHFIDWSTVETLHISHEAIIPGAIYHIQAINPDCDLSDEASYSNPLELTTTKWGDLVGPFSGGQWSGPDGVVSIASDALAILDAFTSQPSAPLKPRADLSPETPDRIVSVSDLTKILFAFTGLSYPFEPGPTPCGND